MRYQTISIDFFFFFKWCDVLCNNSNAALNVWGYHVFLQKLTGYFIGEYTMILQQFFMHVFYRDLYS